MDGNELEFSPEAQSEMLQIVGLAGLLGADGLEQILGIRDHKAFIIGVMLGKGDAMGVPLQAVVDLIKQPTVQAMLDGIAEATK